MSTVRIGIIGAGAIGRTHIRTVQQESRCVIAGIADPTPAAAEYAQQHGIPYFAQYRDLLAQPGLDGVIIATPTGLHAAVGLDCVARRIPMLVEKPIAATVELAEELATAAEKTGVPMLVGHHRRQNPIIAKARDIVRSGLLGRLTSVTALWTLRKPDDYYDIEWRRQAGGGPVLTNLIHDIDTLRFICGEIESLQAFVSSGRGLPFNDTAAVALRFTNGALGTITMSDAVAAPWAWDLTSGENPSFGQNPENCYLLAGTDGALAVPGLKHWHYAAKAGWDSELSTQNVPFEPADPYARQLGHFLAVIRGTEQPIITGADATRTLAATLAVEQAANSGSTITL